MAHTDGRSDAPGGWGLTSHPTPWAFAMVILLAVVVLALLRHFFGSIKVDFATGTK